MQATLVMKGSIHQRILGHTAVGWILLTMPGNEQLFLQRGLAFKPYDLRIVSGEATKFTVKCVLHAIP